MQALHLGCDNDNVFGILKWDGIWSDHKIRTEHFIPVCSPTKHTLKEIGDKKVQWYVLNGYLISLNAFKSFFYIYSTAYVWHWFAKFLSFFSLQILRSLVIYHPLAFSRKIPVKKQPHTLTYQSHPGSQGRNPRLVLRGHPRDRQDHQDQGPRAHFYLPPLTLLVPMTDKLKSKLYNPFCSDELWRR